MIYRFILAKWAEAQGISPTAFEGEYSEDEVFAFQEVGYNVYFFPNYPSKESYNSIPQNPNSHRKRAIKGSDVDTFEYVFVDMDLKDKEWESKEAFIEEIAGFELPPTRIVDSGNGIHVYWRVSNLDAKTFLKLNRRLYRRFKTDPAVSTLNQLMRVPETINVKIEGDYKLAETLLENDVIYSCEDLDKLLPGLMPEDEKYCSEHYDKAYGLTNNAILVSNSLPQSFFDLAKHNSEVHSLFYNSHKDRSAADFRLAHLLFNSGMSREDITTVLFNTSKASQRSSEHRYNYAANIVEKIWTEELKADKPRPAGRLSRSIKDILADGNTMSNGTRFYCHPMLDATENGFRLGQVMGLIGGSGNGKGTVSLNIFRWFVERNVNKNYIHVYVSLEQPEHEIAIKWSRMSAQLKLDSPSVDWDSLVHVLGNYDADGNYRNLGLKEIQEYVISLEKETGNKVGCVVIDHIGVLKQEKSKNGEFDGLIGVCKQLKSFSVSTNTFFIIQSQTSRSKNGGGDSELDMDAAFGTSQFEFYCDFILTTWQPLKRVIDRAPHLTVTAFKMAKIRHKNVLKDKIKSDSVYGMFFDPNTELLRNLTNEELKAIDFWSRQASVLRNKDRKKEPTPLKIANWTEEHKNEPR